MEQIMANIMQSPDVLIIGAAVGFAAAKIMGKKRRGMGGGF